MADAAMEHETSAGAGGAGVAVAAAAPQPMAVAVKDLNFDYGILGGHKPILKGISFELPRGKRATTSLWRHTAFPLLQFPTSHSPPNYTPGSRMILCGDNGTGKSTLLRILAGV